MRSKRTLLAACLLALGSWATAASPRIELELATAEQFNPIEAQAWYQTLTELGIGQLRIRPQQPGDKVDVTVAGQPGQRVYRVRGLLNDRGELLLPGGRFRQNDRRGLGQWLSRLRETGPPPADGKRPPFGLSEPELRRVRSELSQKVMFATRDQQRGDVLDRLSELLVDVPLAVQSSASTTVPRAGQGDPISDELRGVSLGTALAALLRPEGLALQPRRTPEEQLELVMLPGAEGLECWPVGWNCDDPKRVLPKLYTSLEVELKQVALDKALAAVAGRLDVPVLVDHNTLAAVDVEMTSVKVSQPAKRLTYSLLLRKMLVPARMTFEVRVDDAGQPLLWITSTAAVAP